MSLMLAQKTISSFTPTLHTCNGIDNNNIVFVDHYNNMAMVGPQKETQNSITHRGNQVTSKLIKNVSYVLKQHLKIANLKHTLMLLNGSSNSKSSSSKATSASSSTEKLNTGSSKKSTTKDVKVVTRNDLLRNGHGSSGNEVSRGTSRKSRQKKHDRHSRSYKNGSHKSVQPSNESPQEDQVVDDIQIFSPDESFDPETIPRSQTFNDGLYLSIPVHKSPTKGSDVSEIQSTI